MRRPFDLLGILLNISIVSPIEFLRYKNIFILMNAAVYVRHILMTNFKILPVCFESLHVYHETLI